MQEHGGDFSQMQQRYPSVAHWIDASTGINPQPYPNVAVPPSAWRQLPTRAMIEKLQIQAASYYGVSAWQTLAAAGTQTLIQWLPFLRLKQQGISRVAVLSPTYNEHAPSWQQAGHQVEALSTLSSATDYDVVVLTSPNNPDGKVTDHASLAAWAKALNPDGWLVIDEAYVDTTPELSFTSQLNAHPNVIILRSFGKFFGLAGLRLGFALADEKLLQTLGALLGPWPVHSAACLIGAQGLADRQWIAQTRTTLAELARERDALLKQHGFTLAGSHALFALTTHPRAAELFEHLAQHGIYVRRYAQLPQQLRIGSMTQPALQQFAHAMQQWRRHANAA